MRKLSVNSKTEFEVLLSDIKNELELAAWAHSHCPSYIRYHVTDVSDVSYQYDLVFAYYFAEEKDAFMFKLAWAG